MDRTGVDNLAKVSVDMAAEVFAKITAQIEQTCGPNRQLVQEVVAMAFVSIGARVLKTLGKERGLIEEQIRDTYKDEIDG